MLSDLGGAASVALAGGRWIRTVSPTLRRNEPFGSIIDLHLLFPASRSTVGPVQRQEDGKDRKRGYAAGDAQRRGRRIGGRWLGRRVAPEPCQRGHSEPDRRLACRAGKSGCVAEYGPALGDQEKGIPLGHLHDAVQADIDVPS